jgi:DhnA family fructose-bisphosphate aldolase class Ia
VETEPFGILRKPNAKGCFVERNIFQHENPKTITKAIGEVFRERKSIEEILPE